MISVSEGRRRRDWTKSSTASFILARVTLHLVQSGLPLMLLFRPLPRALFAHLVNSSVALFWLVIVLLLRAVCATGRVRAVLTTLGAVPLTARVAACGVATIVAGAFALPLDPTVVHAPAGPVGMAGAILLARSAYRVPPAAVGLTFTF